MDTTEGGAFVEDNKSSGVGERQGSQPCMRDATQTLLPFPGIVQPWNARIHQIGSFRAKKRLVDQGVGAVRFVPSSVPEKLKLQIRELDARQRGKAVLLATQEEASRASREPVDEEEAMAQAWWEGAGEPGEPIGTKQDKTKGTNLKSIVRDSPSSVATATTPSDGGPLHHNPRNSAPCRNVQCNNH
ncbi:hypothetical protein R1flu_025080 [Riccia fluitans]|uniref:Uncharacterized protein n=1 Tax=Riccia fluitans TaxID=41844 RepID=A0ABD1XWQ6_9MARC